MSDFTIRLRNFRSLGSLEWSPRGVCLLSGANGAGKSTVLDALLFLRTLFERGHEAAFLLVGARYFRATSAPESEPVQFELQVGDVIWRLRFPMTSGGLKDHYGEEVWNGKELALRAAMFEEKWTLGDERLSHGDELRCGAKLLWDRNQDAWMKPLVDVLTRLTVYKPYPMNRIRRPERDETRRLVLESSGENLWAVLAHWKGSSIRSEGRFEWVMAEARKAFPGLVAALEFEDGFPILYSLAPADPEHGLPPERMADGLLTGLLHLTAVAGARPGSLIAFDEVENQLHPHAIRALLVSMRARAEELDLSIVMTTHSPVVMNEFRDELDHVYVLDRSDPERPMPTPLNELHDEDWLAQSKLGTLYERLAFGAPSISPP